MKTESLGSPLPATEPEAVGRFDLLVQAVRRSWLALVLSLVATLVVWVGVGALLRANGSSELWAMLVAGVIVSALSGWAVQPYARGCGYNVPAWTALAWIAPFFPFALPLGFIAVQIDLARHLRNYGVAYRFWKLDSVQVNQARAKLTA